jgi:hypothetical protein
MGREKRQALFRSLGLSWYGGLGPKPQPRQKMAEALETIDNMLEVWPAPAVKDDTQKSPAELLGEGMRNGLLLTRDTIRMSQAALDRDGERVDRKLLNTGIMASLAICRIGLRAAEGELRAKHDDVLGRLLDLIKAEKGG